MKKFFRFLLLSVVIGAMLMTAASAAYDPIDVSLIVNETECRTAEIGVSVCENTYTFELEELLSVLGMEMTYDEQSSTVTLSAAEDAEEGGDAWWAFPESVEEAAGGESADWWAFPEPVEGTAAETVADADWWAFPEPIA